MRLLIAEDEVLTEPEATEPQSTLRGFDRNALDHLPIPMDHGRFNSAIGAAQTGMRREGLDAPDSPRHLTGEKGRRLYFIPVESIDSITADGNYVQIHAGGEQYIARNTLKSLEGVLGGVGFVRIARERMINLRQVEFAEKLTGGVFEFALRTGEKVTSTQSFRRAILAQMYPGQK
jgi:two-component system LytT family response regulator